MPRKAQPLIQQPFTALFLGCHPQHRQIKQTTVTTSLSTTLKGTSKKNQPPLIQPPGGKEWQEVRTMKNKKKSKTLDRPIGFSKFLFHTLPRTPSVCSDPSRHTPVIALPLW